MLNLEKILLEKSHDIFSSPRINGDVPLITRKSAYGSFHINRKGIELVSLGFYDTLYFIFIEEDENTTGIYLTKGFKFNDQLFGKKVDSDGNFYDSDSWQRIFFSNANSKLLLNNELIETGFFKPTPHKYGGFKLTAKSKTIFELKRYFEIQNGAEITIFSPAPGIPPQPFFELCKPVIFSRK